VSTIAFIYFTYFVIMLLRMELIFFYYCCVPERLQPLRIHTHNPLTWDERYTLFIRACGVPIACSATHRRSADDGLHHIDDTCVSMVSEDPHVPPSVWGDHGDAVGHRHDP
jgi:hypothetical protein